MSHIRVKTLASGFTFKALDKASEAAYNHGKGLIHFFLVQHFKSDCQVSSSNNSLTLVQHLCSYVCEVTLIETEGCVSVCQISSDSSLLPPAMGKTLRYCVTLSVAELSRSCRCLKIIVLDSQSPHLGSLA